MLRPLELHEVRDHVAEFLTRHDLAICARVSKEWNLSFEPRIWSHVKISRGGRSKFQNNALDELISSSLERHASSIRNIDLHNEHSFALQDLHFPRLLSLVYEGREFYPFLSNTIQSHQNTMTCLSIKCIHTYPTKEYTVFPLLLWKQLMEMKSLRELSLDSVKVHLDDWKLIWNTLSSRLTSLGLERIRFSTQEEDSSGTKTSGVEDIGHVGLPLSELLSLSPLSTSQAISPTILTAYLQQETRKSCTIEKLALRNIIGWTPTEQLGWIQACPRLRSLTWKLEYEYTSWNSDASLLGLLTKDDRSVPELTFLDLEEDDYQKPDEILAFLVTRTPGDRPSATSATEFSLPSFRPFQGLSLTNGTFDSASWRWMSGHLDYFKTISVLLIGGSSSVTGAMVQDMLCTLPMLTRFSANGIRDTDISDDPRPWIGLKLEQLTLGFGIVGAISAVGTLSITRTENEPTVKQIESMTMFLQRISSLKYLRMLDVSNYYTSSSNACLDFRLGHGIEQLSSLRGLERLVVHNLRLNLKAAEMEWMVRNWPRLKFLEGTVHQTPVVEQIRRRHYQECKRQAHPIFDKQFIFQ